MANPCCTPRMIAFLVFFVVTVLGLSVFAYWVEYHPRAPAFTITSLPSSFYDPESYTFHARLDVYNRIKGVHIYYYKVRAGMSHNSHVITDPQFVPNFDQPSMNLTSINATVVVAWYQLDSYHEMSSDVNKTEIIKNLDFKLSSHVRFENRPWWMSKEKILWVVCPDLVVTMTKHNRTLFDGPKRCHAGFY